MIVLLILETADDAFSIIIHRLNDITEVSFMRFVAFLPVSGVMIGRVLKAVHEFGVTA